MHGELGVTGVWTGHYCDPGNVGEGEGSDVFPITASIQCKQGRVSGTMSDKLTSRAITILEILEKSRDHFSPTGIVDAEALAIQHPDATWRVELPPDSDLSGTFKTPRVSFVKRYRGLHSASWHVGTRVQNVTNVEGHEVRYEGTLSSDGSIIEGTWHIRGRGLLRRWLKPERTGTFILVRIEQGPD